MKQKTDICFIPVSFIILAISQKKKIIHNPGKGNLYKTLSGFEKLLFKNAHYKRVFDQTAVSKNEKTMIPRFKTNFKIEMSLPSRKIEQL
jgi:hypothetical protein